MLPELHDIINKEVTFWKKISKVHCIIKGDRNISFFHQSTLKHKKWNLIKELIPNMEDFSK